MSELPFGVVSTPGANTGARLQKTHAARQSSISRPTRASELRSQATREGMNTTPSNHRIVSHRIPSTTVTTSQMANKEVSSVQRVSSPAQRTSAQEHKIMDKSQSMYNLTVPEGQSKPIRLKPTLYMSAQSTSSRSLSSQISPRRAGLGARTISPVEAKRAKRNSRILEGESEATMLPNHVRIPRSVSGIPSPVKPPLSSRTRPSPIPPIPPLPNSLDIFTAHRPSPIKARESGRSVSGPTPISRQRSATLSLAKNSVHTDTQIEDKTSFTSPVKHHKSSLKGSHMQPSNLPPLTVHNLSTPTVRRVNNMSQRLQMIKIPTPNQGAYANHSTMADAASSNNTSIANTKLGLRDPESIVPVALPETHSDSARNSANNSYGSADGEAEPVNSAKSKDLNGFFSRLSLSRSSSRSKHKKKKSCDPPDDSFDSVAAEQTTPERRRRLSLSWVKGKMSPFGSSSSVPKYDSGVPPTIPKSFTSESLASQISHTEPLEEHGPPIKDEMLAPPPERPAPRMSTMEIADEEMRRTIIASKGSKYLVEARAQAEALSARARPREAVDAANAASLDDSPLNLYERGEAIDYDGKIYFTGQKGLQKTGGRMDSALNVNFGYDDDRGDYLINPGDHFAYRYEIVDVLGKGSFGQVLRCLDYKTGSLVAVKVIRNKQRFHAQALVEVRILKLLRKWDPADKHHLIKYTDHFYFRNHLCISTDLLGMNLYEYTKANDFKGCSLNVIRSFATQILSCLALLKTQRVIHCDLKPENILLVNVWESKIKIIDFGSSCFEDQKVYTYIQSRFYRSPEVILGMSYGLPIDMWSMGCILAELYTGYPIFPGEDEQEQLGCIMEIFGPPEKHLIENSTRKKLFFDSHGKPRSVVSSKGRRRKPSSKTLSQAIKCNDEAFLNFMTRCLSWNPDTRLKPEQALDHLFITNMPRTSMDEPRRLKKLVSNQSTALAPRPLPRTPAQQPRIKAGYASVRSNSTSVTTNSVPTLGSPSKAHRRVVSNLPLPRERLST